MEPIYRRHTATRRQLLLFAIVLSISSVQLVHCGCRMQDRNPCETICQWNVTRNSYNCTLRVIVILPKMDTVEASLPRVINHTTHFYIICSTTLVVFNLFQIPESFDGE